MTDYPNVTVLDVDLDVGPMKSAWFGPIRNVHLEQPGGSIEDAQDIVAGVITPAVGESRAIQIDTQAAAATDELDTITNTNVPVGAYVELRSTDAARVIELTHNTGGAGKMLLRDGVNYFLDDPDKRIRFKRVGTDFEEVWRSHSKIAESTIVATTTGSQKDVTGIGPNTRKFVIIFDGTSPSLAGDILVRIGDTTSLKTSGYNGADTIGFSAGAGLAAADGLWGEAVVELIDRANDTWVFSPTAATGGAGSVSLTGPLTRFAVLTTAGVFDSGQFAYRFED